MHEHEGGPAETEKSVRENDAQATLEVPILEEATKDGVLTYLEVFEDKASKPSNLLNDQSKKLKLKKGKHMRVEKRLRKKRQQASRPKVEQKTKKEKAKQKKGQGEAGKARYKRPVKE